MAISPLLAFLTTLVVVLPLLGFWAWMFRDMVNNPDLPTSTPEFFTWPPRTKNHWLLVFILLNVLGAGFYYFTVYREK